MGRGDRIKFWQDSWLGGVRKDQFPHIYLIARYKTSTVYEVYIDNGGNSEWIVNIVRNLND